MTPGRWLWLLAGLLLVAGCGRGEATPPAEAGVPRAVAPETQYDFGAVPVTTDMRQARTKNFSIANTGTGALRLSGVEVRTLEGC